MGKCNCRCTFVTDGVSGSSAEVNGGVTTGRCSLDFFRGGSKVKVNIGKCDFWINNFKMARPPDVVVWGNERKGNSILPGCDMWLISQPGSYLRYVGYHSSTLEFSGGGQRARTVRKAIDSASR